MEIVLFEEKRLMNHPTLSKLMPYHLTVRAKRRESFIFHTSYKSIVWTFNPYVIGKSGQHINIYKDSSKHTRILFHNILIQRQRSTKTSNDEKNRSWFPILQRQFGDSNPSQSFGTLHGSWNKIFCPDKQSQETRR